MKILTILITCIALLAVSQSAYSLSVQVNEFDPLPAKTGESVTVWFKVQNIESEPSGNTIIEIIPKDGLQLATGENSAKSLGVIPQNNGFTIVNYRLIVNEDAPDGDNLIEVRLLEGSSQSSFRTYIQVESQDRLEVDLQISELNSVPKSIKPNDDNVDIEITLQNLGDALATGVRGELVDLPQGIVLSESYSGSALIGNVDENGIVTFTATIDVDEDITPGQYYASLNLFYKYKIYEGQSDYKIESISLPVKIEIKPIPRFEITDVEFLPEELEAGMQNVLVRLTVQNIGGEDGESVRIKGFTRTEQPFALESSSDLVSSYLKPGEVGQGSFILDIDSDANLQTYKLELELRTVLGDEIIVSRDTIDVPILRNQSQDPLAYARWLVILTVIGGIVFVARRALNKEDDKGHRGRRR